MLADEVLAWIPWESAVIFAIGKSLFAKKNCALLCSHSSACVGKANRAFFAICREGGREGMREGGEQIWRRGEGGKGERGRGGEMAGGEGEREGGEGEGRGEGGSGCEWRERE